MDTQTNIRNTQYWNIDKDAALPEQLDGAAKVLASGGTVAFPTETVYGLGADARNTEAVEHIFHAKGRPSDNPLIVHIATIEQLEPYVLPYSAVARRLMDCFWPGPLTIVLPVRPGALSAKVTAGLETVGMRMPDHPVALQLIAASGCPVAAPSANRSGRPSPTLASHVREDLDGRIDGIVDGGATGVGVESTVIELVGERVNILRPGGVTIEALRQVVPDVTVDPALQLKSDIEPADANSAASDIAGQSPNRDITAPRSPGMKYAHYAPRGTMHIVCGESAVQVTDWIQRAVDEAESRGDVTGVLAFDEHIQSYHADVVQSLGSLHALEGAAHRLYAALRTFDEQGVQVMYAEACPEAGMGLAVMNRLVKAAGHRVISLSPSRK